MKDVHLSDLLTTLRMYCKRTSAKYLEITELDKVIIIRLTNRKKMMSITLKKGSFPYVRQPDYKNMGRGVRKLLKDTFIDI
jgi:hypothetical protein